MRTRASPFLVLSVLLATLAPCAAQSTAALDGVNRVLQGLPAEKRTVETLVRLSRMLPQAQEQVDWLLEQLGGLADDEVKKQLGKEIESRLKALGELVDRAGAEQRLAALMPKALEPKPDPTPHPGATIGLLVAILEPAALARAASEVNLATLKSNQFELLARGVPIPGSRFSMPEWYKPNDFLTKLMGAGGPPSASDLIRLGASVRKARGSAQGDMREAYAILSGLADRALGVTPEGDWAALSAQLNAKNLWLWSALANWLANGAGGEAWSKYADVQRGLGKRATEPWAGLTGGATTNATASQSQRADALAAAQRGDVAGALRSMQQAKLAEGGRGAGGALDLEGLKRLLGGGSVDLFIELARVPGGWCAVMLHPEKNDNSKDDRYVEFVIGPAPSAGELWRRAVKSGIKKADRPVVLVASDGPPPPDWLQVQREILDTVQSAQGGGGVVYLASANTLQGAWNLDDTLRAWYGIARREGGSIDEVGSEGAAPQGLKNCSRYSVKASTGQFDLLVSN